MQLPLIMNAKHPETEGFIDMKGARIYYKSVGEGEPMLVLHGGPGLSHDYFLPHMNMLADKFRLIYIDQRGCGKSVKNANPSMISLDHMVDDIDSIRSYFGYEKINILAHSFGALSAMRYAIKYPERIITLNLITPSPADSKWIEKNNDMLRRKQSPELSEKLRTIAATENFKNKNPETLLEFWRLQFKTSFHDPDKTDQLNFYFSPDYKESSKLMKELYKDSTVLSYNLNPELSILKIPVLIIGAESDVIHPEALEELHRTFKNSEYILIEGSGHFPFIEQPQAFRKAILHFRRKL